MTYVFLVAGKGTRLHPITLSYPKTLFKLDDDTTVIQRMVNMIQLYDSNARFIVVTGFMDEQIRNELKDVTFVYNPFYSVTNSIASLWFARDLIKDDDNITILNGDIVMDDLLIKNTVTAHMDRPVVLLDSSIKKGGDCNVQVNGDCVVVMSKGLDEYYGEYAGVVKLDKKSIAPYLEQLDRMIREGRYDEWFEDVLVEMVFKDNFKLYYEDISSFAWTEIDCVDDLVLAKKIHDKSSYKAVFGKNLSEVSGISAAEK